MYVVRGETMSKDSITEASEILIPSRVVITEAASVKRRREFLRWVDELSSEATSDEPEKPKAEAAEQGLDLSQEGQIVESRPRFMDEPDVEIEIIDEGAFDQLVREYAANPGVTVKDFLESVFRKGVVGVIAPKPGGGAQSLDAR